MITENEIPISGTRYIKPTKFLTFKLDVASMHQVLSQVKRIDDPNYIPVFIELPKPDGTVGSYQVHENETMSLAWQLNSLKSALTMVLQWIIPARLSNLI